MFDVVVGALRVEWRTYHLFHCMNSGSDGGGGGGFFKIPIVSHMPDYKVINHLNSFPFSQLSSSRANRHIILQRRGSLQYSLVFSATAFNSQL